MGETSQLGSSTSPSGAAPAAPAGSGKTLRELFIGIKRKVFRENDPRAKQADAIFQTQRKPALERGGYRCIFCWFRSKFNEIHHGDDNHANNRPENLCVICKLCHPYQHVGEAARGGQAVDLDGGHLGPKALGLIRVPDAKMIPARDFNHFLRVLGVALSDEAESATAREVYKLLRDPQILREAAVAFYGERTEAKGLMPGDMAQALSLLTEDEYALRDAVLAPVRLLFSEGHLMTVGRELKKEQSTWATPANWDRLMERVMPLVVEEVAPAAPVTGAATASAEADVDAILAAELPSSARGDDDDENEDGNE